MTEREKVIKGLENIVSDMQEEIDEWRCWTSRPDQATREATPWE